MSALKIGQFVFDRQTASLQKEQQAITLDPRQLRLLEYFLANPERIITRDELQDEIWQQTIVSDNTINKLVANLRKVFGDTAKSSNYILTVPKQGYRFVATVSENKTTNVTASRIANSTSTESAITAKLETRNTDKIIKYGSLAVTCFLVVSMTILNLLSNENHVNPVLPDYSEVLTRIQGIKKTPVSSPDGATGFFINHSKSGSELWSVDINSADTTPPTQLITPFSRISELLGFTGQYLIIRGEVDGQCAWFKTRIDDTRLNIVERSALSCQNLAIRKSLYIEDQILLIANKHTHTVQNRLYHGQFNQSGLSEVSLTLNKDEYPYFIDYLASRQKWLLLTQTVDGQSHYHQLATDAMTSLLKTPLKLTEPLKTQRLFSKDYFSYQAYWHHQGEGVLYESQPPSSQLMYYSLKDKSSIAFVSSEYLVCCSTHRIMGKDNYLFTTQIADYNLSWLTEGQLDINSSSYDVAPALNHTSKGFYFISKSSGRAQIYHFKDDSIYQVSQFEQYLRLHMLELSHNDQWLLTSDGHRLWLLDKNGEVLLPATSFPQGIARIEWLSNQLFALYHNDGSGISVLNTKLQTVAQLSQKWQAVISEGSEQIYLTDDAHNLFSADIQQLFTASIHADPISDIKITAAQSVRISNGELYQVSEHNAGLVKINLITKQIEQISTTTPHHFDIEKQRVIVSQRDYLASEVMITRNR